MDENIKKENVVVDATIQRSMFEYKPEYPVFTNTDDISLLTTEQDQRAQDIVKKIRNDKDRVNRTQYPWEELDDTSIGDRIPKSADKKYEKKTYTVTPARLREVRSGNKTVVATYITVNQYSDRTPEGPYGNGKFMPQSPSNLVSHGYDHAIHVYGKTEFGYNVKGWPFKYLPGTEDIAVPTPEWIQNNIKKGGEKSNARSKTVARADRASRCKPIPGVNNGTLSKSLLQPIKATYRPGSNERVELYKNAAEAFNRMYDAALKDGVRIYVSSGYRSAERQATIRSSEPGGAAGAGKSNHGWGKAIDVWPAAFEAQRSYLKALSSNNFSGLNFTRQDYEKAKQWINLNGDKFGWYWGDAWHESWHFTYMWD